MPAAVRAPNKRRVTLLGLPVLAGVLAASLAGCPAVTAGPTHPAPQVFEEPSEFQGVWLGEIDGIGGTLRIDRLSDGRYYANFRGESRPVRYIVSLTQAHADMGGGQSALANLCELTWQDGRGGVGGGWLLINRENTTLTGTFGRGESLSGMGVLTFIRDDA